MALRVARDEWSQRRIGVFALVVLAVCQLLLAYWMAVREKTSWIDRVYVGDDLSIALPIAYWRQADPGVLALIALFVCGPLMFRDGSFRLRPLIGALAASLCIALMAFTALSLFDNFLAVTLVGIFGGLGVGLSSGLLINLNHFRRTQLVVQRYLWLAAAWGVFFWGAPQALFVYGLVSLSFFVMSAVVFVVTLLIVCPDPA